MGNVPFRSHPSSAGLRALADRCVSQGLRPLVPCALSCGFGMDFSDFLKKNGKSLEFVDTRKLCNAKREDVCNSIII